MEFDTGQEWNNRRAASQPGLANGASSDVSNGVNSFLAWLMLWLQTCLERTQLSFQVHPQETVRRPYEPNRHQQRMWQAKIPPARTYGPYYLLAGRGKTPGQYAEWLALYSYYGRVNVYGMRYWRKTVKGKAAPLGTEHEYWRDPLAYIGKRMSKLLCGIWDVHLWPGWRGLFTILIVATPEVSSGEQFPLSGCIMP